MDAAGCYQQRPGPHIWDVCSQVYIQTTERTCLHLHDDKGTRPPYMQVTIEDVHTHCGHTAQFDAVIEGRPPLTVTWYKDNILMKDSDRVQMVNEDRKYSLVLRDTERADRGVYTCIARNVGGEVSCKAELILDDDEKEQDTIMTHKRRKLKSFFEVKEEIGRGCFGFVKRVVHKGNGATCAAKFIPLRSKTRQQAYRERDILSEVSHDRVASLLDSFETKKTLILILEICCGEELLDRLFRKHSITEREVKLYIRQLLEAICYLHDKNILHLDIKPANILMVHADRDDIKLCDFGFAQKVTPSEVQHSKYGSPEFVAPEIASQAPVSKPSDIWPVGVISYLCLVSSSPFAGQNDRETLLNVQHGNISWSCPGFLQLSDNAKDFMKRTIQMSPEARPSAADCIQHKWFEEGSYPEDSRPLSSKSLRFLVARSRWQRSLMCYKSILVIRTIPELMNAKKESTSLGVPRHLVECSSSSSSSGSSSDNESDISPTSKDCNPSLELHLSIFKMSEKDGLQETCSLEPKIENDEKEILPKDDAENKDIILYSIHETSPPTEHKREHDLASVLDESPVELEEAEEKLVQSGETTAGVPPLYRAATIEVGSLASKKAKTGSFVRGRSADSALPRQRGDDKPSSVCVPRQSIINSTFYNIQACEGPGMTTTDGSLKEKDFIKHRERARRSLMKAGYSEKLLSGLREPLLEQFAIEQRMLDKSQTDQDGQLKKSASFDASKSSLRSSFKVSSRSRSLDDYKSRPLSVYKGKLVEERDQQPSKVAKGEFTKFEDTPRPHSATTGPTEANQLSAPLKMSSTQRPLSAPPVERENAIIAVFHQEPLEVSAKTKERASSAVLERDEGTIITFVKPKRIIEVVQYSATQPPHVIHDTDKMKSLPQPPEPTYQEKEDSLDIGGRVKFTVHTMPNKNDFPVSQASAEKELDDAKWSDDVSKNDITRQETNISPLPDEDPVKFMQFSDDNSRIVVIQHGTEGVLSFCKDIPAHEESMKCPVTFTQQVIGPSQVTTTEDKRPPDMTKQELMSSSSPVEPLIAREIDAGTNLVENERQKCEHDLDSNKTFSPSQIEHDIKVDFSSLHSDGRQSGDKDLQFSIYSDEQCATLEDLVGEMSSLSEEMDVLASEQRQMSQGDLPFPPVIDPQGLQDRGHLTADIVSMETEPSPLDQAMNDPTITSISQCSYYESLSLAPVSPPQREQLDEFTIESCSSSKTCISHSDSSGTGRRSDNFSDFEEVGRHSEVSLVPIAGIQQDMSSTSPGHLTHGSSDFEASRSYLRDFYDIFAFPQQSLQEQMLSLPEDKVTLSTQQLGEPVNDFVETGTEAEVLRTAKDIKTSGPLQPLQESDPSKPFVKERKSSRKRIKLFRPHVKSETTVKSVEPSLKQKVKASVANISRIIKGKPGNGKEGPSDPAKLQAPEQATSSKVSGQVKKRPLPSFRLPSLTSRDKAPAFVEELTDQTVVVGHLVTLSCRTAQSVTDVVWYKDGVSIQSNERVLISSTLKNYHLLTILVVTNRDLGIYACVATNALGSASTCCIIKKAEIPCCPPSPEVAEVYKDGALIVWKPVESSSPVTYFLQYRREGDEWRALTLDISDCCYSTHSLSEGHIYSFRIACISKAGMGPYSNPSGSVRIGLSAANVYLCGITGPEETPGTSGAEPNQDLQLEVKRGRFSTVRLCTEKTSGRIVAVKTVPFTEETKDSALLEYHILKKLHHTNVLQLHAAFLSPQDLVLILDLCEGQELLLCLSAGRSYSELEVRDYLWQMLSAVEFLHDKQILHLDLRSENTIVTEHKVLKILDFGSARFYAPDKVITPERYKDYLETMAPELLDQQGAVPPTDIWAVGITAFIMLSADYPFSFDSGPELEKAIQKGFIRFTHCYAGLSGGAVQFLQSTLWANPWGRPSASDCLKMPWLQEAGLAPLQQPPVLFPTAKLRGFLQERSQRESVVRSGTS